MTHYHIKNAHVIDPLNGIDERKDLYISNGVLVDECVLCARYSPGNRLNSNR